MVIDMLENRTLNRTHLKKAIKDINKLKEEKRISDSEFSLMLKITFISFLENDLQMRVNNVFNKKMMRVFNRISNE
jgi:hypothetical protein